MLCTNVVYIYIYINVFCHQRKKQKPCYHILPKLTACLLLLYYLLYMQIVLYIFIVIKSFGECLYMWKRAYIA